MDYPLGGFWLRADEGQASLNPYSNGLPSRGMANWVLLSFKTQVLIPILMDYPLGEYSHLMMRKWMRVS